VEQGKRGDDSDEDDAPAPTPALADEEEEEEVPKPSKKEENPLESKDSVFSPEWVGPAVNTTALMEHSVKLQGQTYKGIVRDRTQGRGTFEMRSVSADQVCGRYSGEFVGDEAHGLGVLETQTDGGTWEAVSCRWTHGRFAYSDHSVYSYSNRGVSMGTACPAASSRGQ
jgi:hypothetical protein